jgi:hypothetical protein
MILFYCRIRFHDAMRHDIVFNVCVIFDVVKQKIYTCVKRCTVVSVAILQMMVVTKNRISFRNVQSAMLFSTIVYVLQII